MVSSVCFCIQRAVACPPSSLRLTANTTKSINCVDKTQRYSVGCVNRPHTNDTDTHQCKTRADNKKKRQQQKPNNPNKNMIRMVIFQMQIQTGHNCTNSALVVKLFVSPVSNYITKIRGFPLYCVPCTILASAWFSRPPAKRFWQWR